MENPKVLAYRHSQEENGRRVWQDEVEVIDSQTENGVTTYIVKTKEGIVCTAIYNILTGCYYASDIYGVIENYRLKSDMEM